MIELLIVVIISGILPPIIFSMISETDRKKINKILREIKSIEAQFLMWSNIDIIDDCFTNILFINEFEKMVNIRKRMKDQLARIYAINA